MVTEAELIPHYNRHLHYSSPVNEQTVDEICRALLLFPGPKSRFLDLGCGTGWWCDCVRTYGHVPIGTDYAADRVARAVQQYKGILFCNASIQMFYGHWKAGWIVGEFHYATLWDVLEHLQDPEGCLEMAKEMAPAVLATIPINMEYSTHIQVFTSKEDVERRLEPDLCLERPILGRQYALCKWER